LSLIWSHPEFPTKEDIRDELRRSESWGKSKMSPEFQKLRGTFKTTREDRKLWPEA